MPLYNSSNYLKRCINSIQRMIQENENLVEVLLINDGSLDNTLEKAKRLCQQNDFVILNKKHSGVSDTRNYGINKACGQYVTFIDSDDLYESNFINEFKKSISKLPDIVWYDVKNLDKCNLFKINNIDSRLDLMKMVLGINKISIQEGIASKFYKLDFLKKNKLYFDKEVVISEDTLFVFKTLMKASSIFLSPNKFYFIQNEHSLNRFNKQTLKSELSYRKKIDNLLVNVPNSHNKREIIDRTRINGFCLLIHRYYGPLVINKEIKVKKAVSSLKLIADKFGYMKSFGNSNLDYTFSMRYKMLRFLLSYSQFSLALRLDILLDKIKNKKWN